MVDAVLTEDELDTLLTGVTTGDVPVADADSGMPVSLFDFNQQHNIIISRLPHLETIINEFIRGVRRRFFRVYKRDVDVQLAYLHTRRFSDYQNAMERPSNLNMISIEPYSQSGLVILDGKILYILVDQYFGGTGDLAGRKDTKTFSPIELKMSEPFVHQIVQEWNIAWEPTAPMELTVTGRQDNPAVLKLLGSDDVILQAVFQVGFSGNYGEFQVAIPYSILESLRDKLVPESSIAQGDDDAAWRESMAKEIGAASVEVSSCVDSLPITLQELIDLSPGDVVEINMPESICLSVEGMPMFEGRLGALNGKNAIEIERAYSHTRPVRPAPAYLPQPSDSSQRYQGPQSS